MPIDFAIRKIIETQGHITVDNMMRQVLSSSFDSYYKTQENIGELGDFITAPEISQLFGEIIALWAIDEWKKLGSPKKFNLVELGPGQGTLMFDLLRIAKLVPEFFKSAQIHLVEINPYFTRKQQEKLSNYKKDIVWLEDIKQIPGCPSIIIANEFFDALPIKQYINSKGRWYERILVTDPVDGRIKFTKIEVGKLLQKQLLADHPNAGDGAILEESPESLRITRFIGRHLKKYKGSSLIIDYGYNIEKERNSRQYNSTLQAVKDHKYHSIIDSLGEADLTTHIDFNAMKKAAYEGGIKESYITTQGAFLKQYGIMLRLKTLCKKVNIDDANILQKQVDRLISKEQMGDLFKILYVHSIKNN